MPMRVLFISLFFGVLLLVGGLLPVHASEGGARPITREVLSDAVARLKASPKDREARWILARALLAAGRLDGARFHVETLLRQARSSADIELLLKALEKIEQQNVWSVQGSFAILPSTNIKRYTYNDLFITDAGIFTPSGGGEEESGVGVSLGAEVSYRFVAQDAARYTVRGRLDQALYSSSDLNFTQLEFGLRQEKFYVGANTALDVFVRGKFDEDFLLEKRDFGLKFRHSWQLDFDRNLSLSISAEDRDNLLKPTSDGHFYRANLSYAFPLFDEVNGNVSYGVSHFDTSLDHNAYTAHQVSASASGEVFDLGTLGVFGTFSKGKYNGIFPGTSIKRDDEKVKIGLSFRPDFIRINGSSPRLSCSHIVNSSSIALYDYNAVDCSIAFVKSF